MGEVTKRKGYKKTLLITVGLILLLIIGYVLITTISFIYKENQIKELELGMSLEEFERILGKPKYEGKYCQTISTEEINEFINQANFQLKGCGLIGGEKCTIKDIPIYRNNKEKIQCIEMYPNSEFITICEYKGNPKPLLSEDHIEIYYTDKNIVCSMKRYGLGI